MEGKGKGNSKKKEGENGGKKTKEPKEKESDEGEEKKKDEDERRRQTSSKRRKKVVVFHPGSSSLKLGFSTDMYPIMIPHCISFRRKSSGDDAPSKEEKAPSTPHRESERLAKKKKETPKKQDKKEKQTPEDKIREEAIKRIEYDLRESVAVFNQKFTRLQQETVPFGEDNCLEILPDEEDTAKKWTDVESNPIHLIGEEAVRYPPDQPYEIFYPIKAGRFNIDSKHSMRVVTGALETIWTYAFLKLGLKWDPQEGFNRYSLMLVVPDIFEQVDMREIIDILFGKFRFKAVFLHQESVCAAFGVGLPSACVVDIGHQKTSVCCVDDGAILPNSEFYMPIGGNHINRALLWLLKRSKRHYFPYPQCDLSKPSDYEIINLLKESHCHLRREINVESFDFKVKQDATQPTKHFHMNISDVLLISPMGIFHPGLYHPVEYKPRTGYVTGDNWDEEFAAEMLPAFLPKTTPKPDTTTTTTEATANGAPAAVVSQQPVAVPVQDKHTPIPIDVAIRQSIASVDKVELQKKMFSSIVLIGGSSLFDSIIELLEDRVFEALPSSLDVERVEVILNKREIDPRFLSWKGAAVLSSLDSTEEMWIKAEEWETFGFRVIREKVPFAW